MENERMNAAAIQMYCKIIEMMPMSLECTWHYFDD